MRDAVRRMVLPLALLLIAGTFATGPADSAPTWVAPSVPLSAADAHADSVEVAVNDAGDAVAVWRAGYDTFARAVVQASVHPVGGGWSAPVDLSASDEFAGLPQVAIDAAGNATAVWEQADAAVPFIEAAFRPAGGSWSEPLPISDTSKGAFLPKVAVDDAGNAVAIWNSDLSVQWSSRPLGGSWSSPVPFEGTLSSDDNRNALTMTPGGVATAAWTDIEPGHEVVVVASRPAGGSWSTPDDVSSLTEDAHSVDLASSASGKALLTWVLMGPNTSTPDLNDVRSLVQATVRPDAASAWGSIEDLSSTLDEADFARAGMDDIGRGGVVWSASDSEHPLRVIQTARFTADGEWTGRVDLSATAADATVPDVAIAGMGDVIVVWRDDDEGVLQTARRPVGLTSWGSPQDLADAGPGHVDPRVAADSAGNGVAVWTDVDSGDGSMEVRARAFDAVGPVLGALAVPKKTQAEKATTMSVDIADAWSAFTVVWTFGDGKQATGTTVKHTYAKSGLYKVFMTATDAVGNVTKDGATIFAGPPLPRVSGLQLTKTTIHVVGSGKLPRATRLKLTLNAKALVVVKLKRTTRFHGQKVLASLSDNRDAGQQSFRLTSKVGTKLLPPGTYRVTVTARNGVGTSTAKTVQLKIIS